MRKLFTKQAITIPAGQTVSGVAVRNQTLRVLQGRVWITVEGISHDYWLSAGDSFTAIPGRLVVAEAHGIDSRIDCPPGLQWRDVLRFLRDAVTARMARHGTVGASFKRHRACSEGC